MGNHPTYATDPTGLFEGGNASGTSGIPTVTTYGSGALDALVGGASYGGSLGSSQQTVFADAGLGGAITGPTAGPISPGLYAGLAGSGGGYGGNSGSYAAANSFGQMNAGNNTLSFVEPGGNSGGMASIANSLGNMPLPSSLTSGGNNSADLYTAMMRSFGVGAGLGGYGDSAYAANSFSNTLTLAGGLAGVGESEQQRTIAAMGDAGYQDLMTMANPFGGDGPYQAARADLQWLAQDYNNAGLGNVAVAPIFAHQGGVRTGTLFPGGMGFAAAVGRADVQANGYMADPARFFQESGLQSDWGPYTAIAGGPLTDLAFAGIKAVIGRAVVEGADWLGSDAVDGTVGQLASPRTVSLNVLNPEFTPYASNWLQNATDRAAAELAANPALARTVLSRPEYEAGQNSIGMARMQYGNAVERLVAKDMSDELGSQLVQYTGGPGGGNMPDFVGVGPAQGQMFDITTPGQVASKAGKWYGPGLITPTYVRPPGFTVFP